jgi:hypothetical protein
MSYDLELQQQKWKEVMLTGLKSELRNGILMVRSPKFINKTNMAVNLETWQSQAFGFEEMVSKLVLPGKKAVIVSSTGEWLLNTYLYDNKLCDIWRAAGYTVGNSVGKFRNIPCASGDYSWMYEKGLDIIFDPIKNTATFVKL